MSISGKCYLSLYETNCSANRGACRQLCRRKYTVTDTETGAALDIDGATSSRPKTSARSISSTGSSVRVCGC